MAMGLWENPGGSHIFVFYCFFMTKFFEVFWGGTWDAPSSPPPPICIFDLLLNKFQNSQAGRVWPSSLKRRVFKIWWTLFGGETWNWSNCFWKKTFQTVSITLAPSIFTWWNDLPEFRPLILRNLWIRYIFRWYHVDLRKMGFISSNNSFWMFKIIFHFCLFIIG
jgi:hypothetical protein